jgi:ATP-binding cassette, subfamily B, bacterial HlyB/CyaB
LHVTDDAAMPQDTDAPPQPDSGLACLLLVASFHGLAAEAEPLRHRFGEPGKPFGASEILRAALDLGLKARETPSTPERLAGTPLPAIACCRDGSFVVLAAVREDRVLVHDPAHRAPVVLPRDEFLARWQGRLILVARRAPAAEGEETFGFRWFLPALLRYRRLFGEVVVASFFVQLLALVTPLFFQVVVDKVLVHRGLTTLDVLAVGLLVVAVFEVALGGLRTFLFAHTTNRVDVLLGARVFRHLLALPLAYFRARRVGDSVARVRELEHVRQFITGTSLTLLIDLVFTTVFLGVLFLYSPPLAVLVVGSLPFFVALSLAVTPLLRRRIDERFRRGAENQAFLVESITGVETLKAMAVEPQMQRRWEEQLAGYVTASFRAATLGNLASQGAALIGKLTSVAILWAGATRVMDGELTVGQLVAFNMIAGQVTGPILRLAQVWQEFQQAGLSVRRLGDILNAPPEPARQPGRSSLPALRGGVRLDGASFRYAPDRPLVLDRLSFEIAPGEVVGIVGRSGSGKSTLAKLVQRLYVPESGRVLVDGVDLALVDPGWLRRRIGVVLQDSVLFSRSVRENIALADPGLPLERVVHAARLAGAHEFILQLPEGYDTVLSELGTSLSGGQRQRVAIARALVNDPRILILDEATSALDYESERVIQQNMRAICRDRTVIVIAHRLSTVRSCDRIIVLDAGRVAEQGSHEELLRQGGLYARLHALQSGVADTKATGRAAWAEAR